MSEREIADLKLTINKQKNYIEYLKDKIKEKDHKIQELSMLLNTKINFKTKVGGKL